MGGTGKSTMGIIEALANASGKNLTHDTVHGKRSRVVLINLEDTRNTMDKRIAACMRQFDLKPEDIGDRLITLAKGEIAFKIAKQKRNGEVEPNEDAIAMLTNLMVEKKADVLSIDSFIRTHAVPENDNNSIEQVLECFERIAKGANCAVHLWHHTRKSKAMEQMSVESARGAQAFIDACRSVRIMETMSTKEYTDLVDFYDDQNISFETPRGFFFRCFNGKRNFAPPVENSDWYMFVSVCLKNAPFDLNGTGEIGGDSMGVATPWEYPEMEQPDVTGEKLLRIIELMKAGGPWRNDNRSTKERWVGHAIAEL
jgi:hypothetical protein